MLKIYLAGPDVFETDAIEQGKMLKKLCKEHGFEGLFPLDNEIVCDGTPYDVAKTIREANIKLIEECNVVMANLNPFRGLEPDSGTVYEVGYAAALGKKVYAYAADLRPMIERVRDKEMLSVDAERCQEGKIIEDFGLSHNLMMLDLVVANSAEQCLTHIANSEKHA